jgi:hypothetical protein
MGRPDADRGAPGGVGTGRPDAERGGPPGGGGMGRPSAGAVGAVGVVGVVGAAGAVGVVGAPGAAGALGGPAGALGGPPERAPPVEGGAGGRGAVVPGAAAERGGGGGGADPGARGAPDGGAPAEGAGPDGGAPADEGGAERGGAVGPVGADDGGLAGGRSPSGASPADAAGLSGAAGRGGAGAPPAGARGAAGRGATGVRPGPPRSGASPPGVLVTNRRGSGSGGGPPPSTAAGGAVSATGATDAGAGAAGAAAAAAFLGGSSGWTGRRRPSRSAFRRTRSAWASSMLDEWLFTPMPSATHRSSVSLLVSPSSRANSYSRILAANGLVFPPLRSYPELSRVAAGSAPEPTVVLSILARSVMSDRRAAMASTPTSVRRARVNARRRTAASTQATEPRQSHAPRPGRCRPTSSVPSGPAVIRTSSAGGATRRQPMQVRSDTVTARGGCGGGGAIPPSPLPRLPGLRREVRPGTTTGRQ